VPVARTHKVAQTLTFYIFAFEEKMLLFEDVYIIKNKSDWDVEFTSGWIEFPDFIKNRDKFTFKISSRLSGFHV
jgi:hypothetical protein